MVHRVFEGAEPWSFFRADWRSCQKRAIIYFSVAGWSSLVARWAHNPKVVGSNPAPATKVFVFLVIERSLNEHQSLSEVSHFPAAFFVWWLQ
jgi:hypothetical protein